MSLDPALVNRVRRRLAADTGDPDLRRLVGALRAEAQGSVGGDEVLLALPQLRSELLGAGPLEPFLQDQRTTDVLVNGADEVWVDQGEGLERVDVRFADPAAVRRLAARLAASAGRRLDDAQPWVDVRLPDGTRLHAVLPPLASRGPYLSLRVLRHRTLALDDLVAEGSVGADGCALLRAIVTSRLAFLISGATGCGKTTLLATLLGCVPPAERIVLVEDCAELRPVHPHVLGLEARPPNIEGAGAVTLRDLVRQALRMRPDRLVVGEVRGAEVVDLLAALNTGHEGGAGTVHSNSAADVPARLEALAAVGGMAPQALHSQLLAALQCVVSMRRDGPHRVIDEVAVFRRRGAATAVLPAWRRNGGEIPGRPVLAAMIASRGGDPAVVP